MANDIISIKMDEVLADVADKLVLKSPAGQKALASATREMSRWLTRQVKRTVAKSLNIRQKDLNEVFKFRIKNKIIAKEFYAEVWIGLDPLPLLKLGAEQHGPGVVWADKNLRLGAFIANVYGYDDVYRRKYTGPGSTQKSRSAVSESRARKGLGSEVDGRLPGRFPLERQTIPIDKEVLPALKRVEREATLEYRKRVIRRLNFYLNPELRRRKR